MCTFIDVRILGESRKSFLSRDRISQNWFVPGFTLVNRCHVMPMEKSFRLLPRFLTSIVQCLLCRFIIITSLTQVSPNNKEIASAIHVMMTEMNTAFFTPFYHSTPGIWEKHKKLVGFSWDTSTTDAFKLCFYDISKKYRHNLTVDIKRLRF